MSSHRKYLSQHASLLSAAAPWAVALLIAGLIGGLWFVLADDSTWEAVPLAALLILTAAAGIAWQQSRARARRKWQAALDAYAEQEIRQERRRTALKRVRTLSTAQGVSGKLGRTKHELRASQTDR